MVFERIGEVVIAGVTRPIRINPQSGRFEIDAEGPTAFIDFRVRGSALSLIHTEVPEPLRRKGLADALVHAALEYARAHHMTVRPICPFVSSYIRRHPSSRSLVIEDEPSTKRPQ